MSVAARDRTAETDLPACTIGTAAPDTFARRMKSAM
jgi:hypothetical protein